MPGISGSASSTPKRLNSTDQGHTYARPGEYTVIAVLFSGVGSAFPGDGAGPIYAERIRIGKGHA